MTRLNSLVNKLLFSAICAFILSSCSGSPFGGLPGALDDYNSQHNTSPGSLKGKSWEDVKTMAEKNQQKLNNLSSRIEQEARKLDGKTLDVDLNGEMEILEPIKISFVGASGGSASLALRGKVKTTKDIKVKPWNSHHATQINEGKMVRIDLAVPEDDDERSSGFGYEMLNAAGRASAKVENGMIVVPAGTEIIIDCPKLSMHATDYDDRNIKRYKAASKKLWLAVSGVSEN